ncbi:MAG: hypothetical protein ACI97A_000667 [Planctomycetota bacterium]|jgi:hypothetical protein
MKRPFIIAVAGPGSNSGKTHLVCALIRHLRRGQEIGAVKIATSTPDHMCARTNLPCDCLRFDGKMRLLKDPAYINKVGKDTAMMHAAGAQPVWWLQTTSDVQTESSRFLHGELEGPSIWVIEGSGPIRAGIADLTIVVARADGKKPKDSWYELVPMANILAVSHEQEIFTPDNREAIPGLKQEAQILDFSGTSLDLNASFQDALVPYFENNRLSKK